LPVLLEETLSALDPKPGRHFIDATVGQGGHAEAILRRTLPAGRLLGFDRDPRNLEVAKQRLAPFGKRAVLVRDSYANLARHARANGFEEVDGILFDIGFSSAHIEDASRGFSFQKEGPLDMRYDPSQELTAAVIVNGWNEDELAQLFRQLGEEGNARQIAQAIVARRRKERILTTQDLSGVVASVNRRRGKIHPATKVFQALRIAVNDELGELEKALPQALELLKPGGRLAVISFHSLEDRIVKRFLAAHDGKETKTLTKRVIEATEAEIAANPRSRSAKLRIAEKR
jgi:16S rRNA (cytosine1402-N4)-methyltransferase